MAYLATHSTHFIYGYMASEDTKTNVKLEIWKPVSAGIQEDSSQTRLAPTNKVMVFMLRDT